MRSGQRTASVNSPKGANQQSPPSHLGVPRSPFFARKIAHETGAKSRRQEGEWNRESFGDEPLRRIRRQQAEQAFSHTVCRRIEDHLCCCFCSTPLMPPPAAAPDTYCCSCTSDAGLPLSVPVP